MLDYSGSVWERLKDCSRYEFLERFEQENIQVQRTKEQKVERAPDDKDADGFTGNLTQVNPDRHLYVSQRQFGFQCFRRRWWN